MTAHHIPSFAPSVPAGNGLRIAIFNVKFSANLGDGLIAECLEAELQRLGPDIRPFSIDLAGRDHYGDGLKQRRRLLWTLQRLPPGVRRTALQTILGALTRYRLRPRWRSVLTQADAVIVGGGQLFQDVDLNFPIKLSGALGEARRAGLPVAVFGVGVSPAWSSTGGRLFGRALSRGAIVDVAVRDGEAQVNWNRNLAAAGVRPARLCRDPALLAREHFRPLSAFPRERPLIGLGLVHPLVLRHHDPGQSLSNRDFADYWVELAAALTRSGHDIALFTNGAEEDNDYLDTVFPRLAAVTAGRAIRLPRPRHPAELAAAVSHCDALAAHRLHANILAYSYAIPHVGFAWDPKVDGFFRSVGRERFVVPMHRTPPAAAAAALMAALSEGIAERTHRRVLQETRRAIGQMGERLLAAVQARDPAGPRKAASRSP